MQSLAHHETIHAFGVQSKQIPLMSTLTRPRSLKTDSVFSGIMNQKIHFRSRLKSLSPVKHTYNKLLPMSKSLVQVYEVNSIATHVDICKNITIPQLVSKDDHDEIEENVKKSLIEIYQSLSNCESLMSIPLPLYNSLKDLISTNLFHKRDSLPKSWIYSDVPIERPFTHMYELEIIYNIYSLFINHLPVEELSQWITNDMILNMIKCIGTPDVSEQALLVKAFGEIIDKLPYTKPLIYHKLLYIISNYNNGEFLHYHIIVSLKILRLLFRSKEYKWDCEHIMELYKVLYPLYKSEFLSCFYIELNALLRFLFSLDASLSSDLSSYLLQHFPITNSSKQFPFLHQIMSLIIFNSKCIKYNDMKLLSSILFKCISSDNQNVAINSIFFICNENKIVALSSISHSIVASIVNGLIEQSNSWSQTISSSAIDSLKYIMFES